MIVQQRHEQQQTIDGNKAKLVYGNVGVLQIDCYSGSSEVKQLTETNSYPNHQVLCLDPNGMFQCSHVCADTATEPQSNPFRTGKVWDSRHLGHPHD